MADLTVICGRISPLPEGMEPPPQVGRRNPAGLSRAPRGLPRKSVTFRLPEDTYDALRVLSASRSRTISALAAELLDRGLLAELKELAAATPRT